MTPKEKAKELVYKFELVDREFNYQDEINLFESKQCALICVDEIINEDFIMHSVHTHLSRNEYWEEVKLEINKL